MRLFPPSNPPPAQACFSGCLAVYVQHYYSQAIAADEAIYIDSSVFYSSVTMVLSFLTVFRCNMAYSRYWEGRSAIQLLVTKLDDMAIHLNAFVLSQDDEAAKWRNHMGAHAPTLELWQSRFALIWLCLKPTPRCKGLIRFPRQSAAVVQLGQSLGLYMPDNTCAYQTVFGVHVPRRSFCLLSCAPPRAVRLWV